MSRMRSWRAISSAASALVRKAVSSMSCRILRAGQTLFEGFTPTAKLGRKIGQLTESVEVMATAPLVNATTTDLGVVMDRSKMDALPLNGRDWTSLATSQPGISKQVKLLEDEFLFTVE